MSGCFWEEEASFSAINEIENNSISILTDVDISLNNFICEDKLINFSDTSSIQDASKCKSRPSSSHLPKNDFVSLSCDIKDFNVEINKDDLNVCTLLDVSDQVISSKVNDEVNPPDITKESSRPIESSFFKGSNLNNLHSDIKTYGSDANDSVCVSLKNNPLQHYNDFVKPRLNVRHDLEYSFSRFFSDNKPKGKDYIKEFVAGRIANIIEKVRKSKSSSCSDLVNLSSSQYLMKSNEDTDDFNNVKIDHDILANDKLNNTFTKEEAVLVKQLNNTFTSDGAAKINGTFSRPGHFSGSIEVLNCFDKNEKKVDEAKGNDTYEVVDPLYFNTSYQMKKSFSCSGLPDVKSVVTGKNDSILDIEMKLDDSIPSEDERDEFGLPIKRFMACTPSKMVPDLTQTIQKFNILRASFCEPNDDIDADDEPVATVVNNPDAVKEPLLPEFHGGDTPPRNMVKAKGPMKAVVPLQNMTKHMTEKMMSPFINNPGKVITCTANTSHALNESFDEKTIPVAASTPSDGRSSRRESVGSGSRRRSLSAGATPSKTLALNNGKLSDATVTIANSSLVKTSVKNNATFDSNTFSKTTKQTTLIKPQIKSTLGLRRPSSAPAQPNLSIRPPLTTKLLAKTQSVNSMSGKQTDSRCSTTSVPSRNSTAGKGAALTQRPSISSTVKNSRVSRFSANAAASQKCSVPLRPSVVANNLSSLPNATTSNLKRPSVLSKFRVPGLGKENKK